MTVYVSCRAACAVVRVCTVRSLRVCACGVWAHFFAQGELTRPSASSGAHRPRPCLREPHPRCLAHTPHAPALVPPVVDHLPCRGGVSLRSRSACAAQQGRPIPSSPERSKKTAKEGKTLPRGPQTRPRNFSFRTSRHPQQSKLVRNMHHCAATNPKYWFTSLATSTISVPQVLTQANIGTVFDQAQGLKSDGTQELRIIGCVIIANRHEHTAEVTLAKPCQPLLQ